jgi:drug/metabolite transporter (DMT)-like permease
VPAGVAGVFTGIIPLSAVALAVVLLDEPLRLGHLVGIVCVFAALGLTLRGEVGRESAALGDGGEGAGFALGAGQDFEVEVSQGKLGGNIVGIQGHLAAD